MATSKRERGRPAVQPPDEDIDFSDLPEVTDFSKGVRGKFYEQATGKPLPQAVRLLNKAEAENRRLRAALRALYEATHAYLDASLLKQGPSFDDRAAELNGALADAFEALERHAS